MIGLLVGLLVQAAPLGACADRAGCRFKAEGPMADAVVALGLAVGELKAEPLKKPGGDVAFTAAFSVAGDQATVKVVSLHRPAAVWGEGAAQVQDVAKPEWKQRALRAALKVALPRALEDLQLRIAGVRKVTLSAQLNGLDAKARDHVERSLFPCLKQLFDLTGPVTAPAPNAGFLDEALEYVPEKNEPRQSLEWQVGRVRDAMLGGVRAKCGVGGTPLQGWATSVAADPLNRAVVVSFRR